MHMHSFQGRCLVEVFESPLALTAPSSQPRRGDLFLSISLGSICHVPILSGGRNTLDPLLQCIYRTYIISTVFHTFSTVQTLYTIIHILPCAITKCTCAILFLYSYCIVSLFIASFLCLLFIPAPIACCLSHLNFPSVRLIKLYIFNKSNNTTL